VELAEGAEIRFDERGQEGFAFESRQIDKMFEVGFMQPLRTTERDPDVAAGVTSDGDARFLVGQVDLGREVGMEVLGRGLEAAVDASYREHRERHPTEDTDEDGGEDPGTDERTFNETDLGGLSREVTVPVSEVRDRLDDLLDKIEHGDQVVLVEDGKRVAVMMSWSAYVHLRKKLVGMAVAFWSAWQSGVFDVAGYATDVARVLRRHPTAKPNGSSDDESRTSEGGDGDEHVW
jgi:prevent-host-death family protein